jgi:hypothetical protein
MLAPFLLLLRKAGAAGFGDHRKRMAPRRTNLPLVAERHVVDDERGGDGTPASAVVLPAHTIGQSPKAFRIATAALHLAELFSLPLHPRRTVGSADGTVNTPILTAEFLTLLLVSAPSGAVESVLDALTLVEQMVPRGVTPGNAVGLGAVRFAVTHSKVRSTFEDHTLQVRRTQKDSEFASQSVENETDRR